MSHIGAPTPGVGPDNTDPSQPSNAAALTAKQSFGKLLAAFMILELFDGWFLCRSLFMAADWQQAK